MLALAVKNTHWVKIFVLLIVKQITLVGHLIQIDIVVDLWKIKEQQMQFVDP